MRKPVYAIPILLALIMAMSGCASKMALLTKEQLKASLEKCTFTLKAVDPSIEVQAPKVTLKGVKKPKMKIHFDLKIEVKNNSMLPLATSKLSLMIFASGSPIPEDIEDPTATGTIKRKVVIPPGSKVDIKVRISVSAEKVTKDLAKIVKAREVYYRAIGTFFFPCVGYEIPLTLTLCEGSEVFK